jgi:hypothetical protein
MILHFLFEQKKYSMPTVEEINLSTNKSLNNENKKNKADCEYMYNLLNKCLHNAVNSNDGYAIIEFDRFKLSDTSNTYITKCHDFNNYSKELETRGIQLNIYDRCEYNSVTYNSKNKILTIYGR